MAGRIRQDDIAALRERADIVAVVSDHTRLVPAGQRVKGLCPFHSEKTPSFTVDPGRGLWVCFGCGAGGDVYTFLMQVEGLDFVEAVEQLARRTGFTLHYEDLSAGQRRELGRRSRLLAVNSAAVELFRRTLMGDEGQAARDYLKARGFGRDDAERFQLGFAPTGWDATSRYLEVERRFNQDDIVMVGLAKRTPGGLRDRFRGRLLFPVHDAGGEVIGFGGRLVPGVDYGDFDGPKYLNTPATPLYHKSRVLYGIPQARSEMARTGEVLVCEGYTDVMALHRAGFANAVATCGTAVGTDHLRVLSRYAQRVVLAFDSDDAGVKAAERAWAEALRLDADAAGGGRALELRVLVLADGADPADHVRAVGVDRLRTAVAGAVPVVPFVLRHTLARADLSSDAGRTAALRDALAVLGREPDPDLRRLYARSEVADRIGLAYGFVVRTADRLGIELDSHQGTARPVIAAAAARPSSADIVLPGVARARRERSVLRAALQHPELLPDEWYELTADDFSHERARAVHRTLDRAGGAGVELDSVLDAAADDALRQLVRELALEDDPELADTETAAATVQLRVGALLADRLESDGVELRAQLDRINAATEPGTAAELMRRLGLVQERVRRLRTVDG